MVTVAPRVGVPAPIPVASRRGLLSVATTPPDNNSRGWHGGIVYQPERPAIDRQYQSVPIACPPDAFPSLDTVTEPDLVQWDPYLLTHVDKTTCVLPDWLPEVRRRAELALERYTGDYLEWILWSNEVMGADYGATHPNVGLADSVVTQIGVEQGVVSGWGLMLQELGVALGGNRGVIHVSQKVLSFLNFYGLVETRGEQLFAKSTDHLVAAGTGYNGSDPTLNADPNTHWIYGTSPIQVRLGPVTVPFVRPGDGFDIGSNEYSYRAQRIALASWDRSAHLGVPLCLPDPGPDCPA